MHNNRLWCKWGHPSAATDVVIYSVSTRPFTRDKAPRNLQSSHSSGLRMPGRGLSLPTQLWRRLKRSEVGTGIYPFLTIASENLYSFHSKVNKVLFSNKWYPLTDLLPAEFSNLTSSCACNKAPTLDVPQHISPWRGACYSGLHGASHLVAPAGRKDGITGEQYEPPCCLHTFSRCHVLLCFISFKTNICLYACSLRDELRMKIKGDG